MTLSRKIENLERAQKHAGNWPERQAWIKAQLEGLYAQQELELWAWVAKSQLRRHGLPAHRLFSEQDRCAAMQLIKENQLPVRAN